jgi:hypothetical protein
MSITFCEMITGADLYTVCGVLVHLSAVRSRRYANLITGSLAEAVNLLGQRYRPRRSNGPTPGAKEKPVTLRRPCPADSRVFGRKAHTQ